MRIKNNNNNNKIGFCTLTWILKSLHDLGPIFEIFFFLFSLIIGLKPPILDPWSIEPGPPCKLGLSFIINHLMYLTHFMLKTHQCQNGKKQSMLHKGGKGPS